MIFAGLGTAIAGGGALALISRCGCLMLIDGSEGTWKQLRRGGRRAAKSQRAWLGGHEREMSCCVSET